MNARRIVSRASASSAGSPSSGSTRASGTGSTHSDSGSIAAAGVSAVDGPLRSIGRARRLRPLSMSRHTLVAMR